MTALEEEVRDLKCKDIAHEEEACQLREEVSEIKRLRDQKEKEQQVLHEQLHITQQQARKNRGKVKKGFYSSYPPAGDSFSEVCGKVEL